MKNSASLVALGTLAILAAAPASAITILQYDTEGSTTAMAPVVEGAGVSGLDFTAGSGLTVQTFSTFNFKGWDTASTTAAAAYAANDYWEWGFTSTQAYDLSAFDITLDRSSTGPDDFDIQLSVNGGSYTSVLSHDFGDATSAVNFLGNDLSSYGGVTSATFRLMAFNSESGNGTFDLETYTTNGNDAFVLTGDVSAVVPLPAGLPLALTGFGALALLRRRKARS